MIELHLTQASYAAATRAIAMWWSVGGINIAAHPLEWIARVPVVTMTGHIS